MQTEGRRLLENARVVYLYIFRSFKLKLPPRNTSLISKVDQVSGNGPLELNHNHEIDTPEGHGMCGLRTPAFDRSNSQQLRRSGAAQRHKGLTP